MSYSHLTSSDRARIAALKRAGHTRNAIARQLGKHPSTIGRELRRNRTGRSDYNARTAQQKTVARRRVVNQRFRKLVTGSRLTAYVVRRLRQYWSPEQIAGRLERETGQRLISHLAIYEYVRTHPGLKKYLRIQKPYRRHWGTARRYQIRDEANRKSIDQRPAVANHRKRLGDWEGDTVVGTGSKDRLATYVDRKSGKAIALQVQGGSGLAEVIANKTVATFRKLPTSKRCTITYDRGTEFSDHQYIEDNLPLQVYFAHPYHSWERGTNENTNGLYRQFFPKKTNFALVSQSEVDKVTRLLNTRPRKRHQYRTPDEVFRDGK